MTTETTKKKALFGAMLTNKYMMCTQESHLSSELIGMVHQNVIFGCCSKHWNYLKQMQIETTLLPLHNASAFLAWLYKVV